MLGVGLHTSTLQTTTSEIFLLSNNQYHVSRVPDTERSLWYCFLLIKWSFRTYLDRCIRISSEQYVSSRVDHYNARIFRGFSSLERKSVFEIIILFYLNHKHYLVKMLRQFFVTIPWPPFQSEYFCEQTVEWGLGHDIHATAPCNPAALIRRCNRKHQALN